MAYDETQKRLFARELARAGLNVKRAVEALQRDYESMPNVHDSTLKRWMAEPGAAAMIEEEGKRLTQIAVEAAIKVERERAEYELRGSEVAHIAQVEALIATIYDNLKEWLKNPSAEDAGKYMDLYARLLAIHDKRLVKILPCISDGGELQTVLQTVGLELQSELGARAGAFMKQLQEKCGEALHARRKALGQE